MEEILTPVNDGQVSDGGSQQVEAAEIETVNAESVEVTPDKQEQTTETAAPEAKAQSKEENAQFAKVRKEAESRVRAEYEAKQAAKDAEFAAKAAERGWLDSAGNPIKTEAAYWRELDFHTKFDALVNQGKDPEYAKALVELEQLKGERAEQQKEKARQEAWRNFFDDFRKETGRNFDPQQDKLPQEAFSDGVPNIDKYAKYQLSELKAKYAELEKQLKADETNAQNAASAVGPVKSEAPANTGDFITYDTFEANRHDPTWVKKNLTKLTKSREKW